MKISIKYNCESLVANQFWRTRGTRPLSELLSNRLNWKKKKYATTWNTTTKKKKKKKKKKQNPRQQQSTYKMLRFVIIKNSLGNTPLSLLVCKNLREKQNRHCSIEKKSQQSSITILLMLIESPIHLARCHSTGCRLAF